MNEIQHLDTVVDNWSSNNESILDIELLAQGWNDLHFEKNDPLFKYNREGDFVYFVHSFYAKNCENSVTATTFYGVKVTAAVRKDNVFGTQFHPEKSGETGLKMLRAFAEVK